MTKRDMAACLQGSLHGQIGLSTDIDGPHAILYAAAV